MNANDINNIITAENHKRGYDAFGCTLINEAWVHITDGTTSALYRVRDIADCGADAMRDAFAKNDDDLYSIWCSDVTAYHVEDAPKTVQRACRQMGLVTVNW